jgi:hypothetical protein
MTEAVLLEHARRTVVEKFVGVGSIRSYGRRASPGWGVIVRVAEPRDGTVDG